MVREVPCPTGWLATGGLWAVPSSDLGGRPLGWLLLQQCQGVPLLDGAQLLLLRPLELGGVSDLGGGGEGRTLVWLECQEKGGLESQQESGC